MAFLNPKFFGNKKQYAFQCIISGILALIFLFAFGLFLDLNILGAVGATSLCASTGLILMAPHVPMARNRNLIGGYTIGICVGLLCFYSAISLQYFVPSLPLNHTAFIFGGIVVIITQLLMVIFNIEHPPAIGLSVGLILENWHLDSLIAIVICVICLAIVHQLLRKRIINLI